MWEADSAENLLAVGQLLVPLETYVRNFNVVERCYSVSCRCCFVVATASQYAAESS